MGFLRHILRHLPVGELYSFQFIRLVGFEFTFFHCFFLPLPSLLRVIKYRICHNQNECRPKWEAEKKYINQFSKQNNTKTERKWGKMHVLYKNNCKERWSRKQAWIPETPNDYFALRVNLIKIKWIKVEASDLFLCYAVRFPCPKVSFNEFGFFLLFWNCDSLILCRFVSFVVYLLSNFPNESYWVCFRWPFSILFQRTVFLFVFCCWRRHAFKFAFRRNFNVVLINSSHVCKSICSLGHWLWITSTNCTLFFHHFCHAPQNHWAIWINVNNDGIKRCHLLNSAKGYIDGCWQLFFFKWFAVDQSHLSWLIIG